MSKKNSAIKVYIIVPHPYYFSNFGSFVPSANTHFHFHSKTANALFWMLLHHIKLASAESFVSPAQSAIGYAKYDQPLSICSSFAFFLPGLQCGRLCCCCIHSIYALMCSSYKRLNIQCTIFCFWCIIGIFPRVWAAARGPMHSLSYAFSPLSLLGCCCCSFGVAIFHTFLSSFAHSSIRARGNQLCNVC